MNTVAEKLGMPKHGYIPVEKRQERKAPDGDGKRHDFVQYVKEHEGEIIVRNDILHIFPHPSDMTRYTRQLEKMGKITRVKEGNVYHFFLGKKAKPRENGEVKVTRPAAPFSRTEIDKLHEEEWGFLRTLPAKGYADEALGAVVRGMVEFGEYLNGKIEAKGGGDGTLRN